MSRRRGLVVVGVLLVVFAALSVRAVAKITAGPDLSARAGVFPRDHVLRPPLMSSTATSEHRLLPAMNTAWAAAFAAADQTYVAPRLVASDAPLPPGCRNGGSEWAGLYCFDDETIRIAASVPLDEVGRMLAHEVGHHVARRLHGWSDPLVADELYAQCLAGVWTRAIRGAPVGEEAFGGDAAHGSAAEQAAAFARGYARARPADCDAVWTGEG